MFTFHVQRDFGSSRGKKMKHILYTCLLYFFLFPNTLKADHADEYQFGVFPYLPPQRIDPMWSPLAKYLTQAVNHGVEVRTRAEYSQYRQAIREEIFDIAYVQPFAYVETAYFHNYIPLARWISKFDIHRKGRLVGVFVVLDDSPLSSLKEINEGAIAMPPAQAAVSRLGVLTMVENGMKKNKKISITNQRNHIACMQQLVIKKAVACVTATPILSQFEKKTGSKLRIIATTRKIPSSPILVHKRVPVREREIIRNMLLELEKSEIGREFLKNAGLSGFTRTTDADYNQVRKISKSLSHNKNLW